MKFIHVLISAALFSLLMGLVYSTQGTEYIEQKTEVSGAVKSGKFTDVPNRTVNWDDPNLGEPVPVQDLSLKPCSEVQTMPCETSPKNPLKEELDAEKAKPGLFKKGDKVTCIYPAIFWWTDKSEFVKTVGMKCTVIQASEEYIDLEPNYQHIQVDCSKDIDFQSSDQPGVGMVKEHKLMFKVRWFASTDCYNFQQQ